jgi:hypothetical protein
MIADFSVLHTVLHWLEEGEGCWIFLYIGEDQYLRIPPEDYDWDVVVIGDLVPANRENWHIPMDCKEDSR